MYLPGCEGLGVEVFFSVSCVVDADVVVVVPELRISNKLINCNVIF